MAKGSPHTENESSLEQAYRKLGARIKAVRISRGYSSGEKFANEKGFSRAQYAKFEQGRNLQYANIIRIAQALEITLKELFSEGVD